MLLYLSVVPRGSPWDTLLGLRSDHLSYPATDYVGHETLTSVAAPGGLAGPGDGPPELWVEKPQSAV